MVAPLMVPVKHTFIEYSCREPDAARRRTASASRAQSGEEPISVSLKRSEEEGDEKLPCVLYQLCSISAKAAGIWTSGELVPSNGSDEAEKKGKRPKPQCRYQNAQDLLNPSGGTETSAFQPDAASSDQLAEEVQVASVIFDDQNSMSSEEEDSSCDDEICPEYSQGAVLPSIGSAGHGEGLCRRCCFFPKGRCQNGFDCQFCHFAHEKRKSTTKGAKKKPTKKRSRAKRRFEAPPSAVPFQAGLISTWQEAASPPGGHPVPEQQPFMLVQAALPMQVMGLPGTHTSFAMMPVPFCQY